jgi:glucose-fructose oxidoreductase
MKSSITRRQFLHRNLGAVFAATAAPGLVSPALFAQDGAAAPNNRIQVGCIGVGPQGRGVMSNFLAQNDCRVVAVCDVAKRNLNEALNQVNQKYEDHACATYHRYEELLERKDIDAVLIASPDHWHVGMSIDAALAGKDLYLEKPMGLSVAEDQLLRKAVRKEQRIFQFGTQQRSSGQFRQACELVRSGKIGALKNINVWCSASRPGGTTAPVPVPPDLDYERWLGPAPANPYTVDKCFDVSIPDAWKTWWYQYDYALGFIAGWGVHPLDIAYWGHPALMEGRLELDGRGIIPSQGACNTAIAWDVQFRAADGVTMNYRGVRNGYDQINPMNDLTSWEKKYGRIVDHGTAFEGSDGWILVDRTQIRTSPERLVEEKTGAVQLPRSSNHVRNFLDAIRSRKPSICPVEEAVQADILCHLSDIAVRLNRPLTWNPEKESFVKDSQADDYLELRSRRKPWKLNTSDWNPLW